jgi:hypothetical protein
MGRTGRHIVELLARTGPDRVRVLSRLKGANIGVAVVERAGWEDRRHGFLLPLPRRPGRAGCACS